MLRSTKPGSVPLPRVCLSLTLPPSLCPFLGYPCSLLSKPDSPVPVSVALHRAFWEPQFFEPSRWLASLWLLRFKLGPLPRPSLGAAPAPLGVQDQCDPGGTLRGSAPPRRPLPARSGSSRPDPGREQGAAAGAGSGDSEPGSAGSSPRSGRRRRGSRAARPSPARTCGPGRAGAEQGAREAAGCTRTVWASGSIAPTPPRGSARGARPARTPPPGRPWPRGGDPAPAPHPRSWGPDPAHISFLRWSPLQVPSAGPV